MTDFIGMMAAPVVAAMVQVAAFGVAIAMLLGAEDREQG